jgi:hypothetical protein
LNDRGFLSAFLSENGSKKNKEENQENDQQDKKFLADNHRFFRLPSSLLFIQIGAKNIIRTMKTTIRRITNFLHRNMFVLHQ